MGRFLLRWPSSPNHISSVRDGHQEGVERVEGVIGRKRRCGDMATLAIVGIKHPGGKKEAVGFGMLNPLDAPVFFVLTTRIFEPTLDHSTAPRVPRVV
jgi:hypothetical protein